MARASLADGSSGVEVARSGSQTRGRSKVARVSTERVWSEVSKASFAIISHVSPSGEPRSSGVVYIVQDHHLYIAVAPGSWKARHITDGQEVAVTVPVRRGGLLSLLVPIPPATVSFHARAIVHPPGTLDLGSVSRKLESLVPAERRSVATILELVPAGTFLTYGLGVSLKQMTDPVLSQAHMPVG